MGSDFLSQEEIDALLGKSKSPLSSTLGDGKREKEEDAAEVESMPNLELILDFPLKVSVRLGETLKPLAELRQISPGTVFELDRFINDPVDICVNGKLIARGEVVVVDENFGVKITQILTPVDRLKKLK